MADVGWIEGQVINQRDGQPIEGAKIALSGGDVSQEGSSGSDGFFKFENLAAGEYEMVINKAGYEEGI